MRDWRIFLVVAAATGMMAGCGNSGGSDDSDGNPTPQTSVSAQENSATFTTSCGTVVGETTTTGTTISLANPVSSTESESGTLVDVDSGNPVVINFVGGPQAVKLLGMPVIDDSRKAAAVRALRPFVGQKVQVFRGAGCPHTFASGGQGATAQVLSAGGQDLGEIVFASGAVRNTDGGSCGEELVRPCYAGIVETIAPKTGAAVVDFLWKPQADSGYNSGLLVIHASPGPATVFVNGKELPDFGPGNGRDLTARDLSNTGCDYANAVVTIVDSQGLPLTWPDGTTEYRIPDGCQRTEFKL